MRIKCSICGEAVSNKVPENTIVRAWIECVECVNKAKEVLNTKITAVLMGQEGKVRK